MSQLIPYDDRDGQIWLNGELVPWRDAKIHVLTHALHYASAVFEGERCYDGRIFKSTEHSQRLIDSGRILGFEVPYSAAELDAAKAAIVAKMGFKDCYVRPIAWRGSEQMGVSAQHIRSTWQSRFGNGAPTTAICGSPARSTSGRRPTLHRCTRRPPAST